MYDETNMLDFIRAKGSFGVAPSTLAKVYKIAACDIMKVVDNLAERLLVKKACRHGGTYVHIYRPRKISVIKKEKPKCQKPVFSVATPRAYVKPSRKFEMLNSLTKARLDLNRCYMSVCASNDTLRSELVREISKNI